MTTLVARDEPVRTVTVGGRQARYGEALELLRVWRTAETPLEDLDAALARVLRDRDGSERPRFVDWIERRQRDAAAELVVLARLELDLGREGEALRTCERALALDPHDLEAQDIIRELRARLSAPSAVAGEDLSAFFCPRPFEELEISTTGETFCCCRAWLPKSFGNVHRQTAEEIWNSATAQEVRRSILDGDFRHCSRLHCQDIVGRRLPLRDQLADPAHREILASRSIVMARRPRWLTLSYDHSCNLSCPSCRTELVTARKSEVDRLRETAETIVLPLLRDARLVRISGSGDPFGSAHFRWLMQRIGRAEFPRLRFILQTNGQLLDQEAWDSFDFDGRIKAVFVSIDAADASTYAVLRRGGTFDRLLRNLSFLAGLRASGRIDRLRLDFVVQAANFREMPAVIELARVFGCDQMHFQLIRNWGSFTAREYEAQNVASPLHPEHGEFLEVLRHPSLADPIVDITTGRRLWEYARSDLSQER